MVGLGLVYFVASSINRAAGGPRWVPWTALGLASLVLLAWVARRAWHAMQQRSRAVPTQHGTPDERFRVRCVGWEVARASFDRLGPVEDRPFEPRVFSGFFAVKPGRRVVVAWVVLTVLMMSAEMIWDHRTTASGSFLSTSSFAVSSFASAAIVAVCLPTYLRVVPGRLDVLRYTVFTRRATRSEFYDLGRARVLVDLNARTIRIDPPPDEPWEPLTTRLWFGWVPRGEQLAHAVLEAAISSTPSPPLPEDELVG